MEAIAPPSQSMPLHSVNSTLVLRVACNSSLTNQSMVSPTTVIGLSRHMTLTEPKRQNCRISMVLLRGGEREREGEREGERGSSSLWCKKGRIQKPLNTSLWREHSPEMQEVQGLLMSFESLHPASPRYG